VTVDTRPLFPVGPKIKVRGLEAHGHIQRIWGRIPYPKLWFICTTLEFTGAPDTSRHCSEETCSGDNRRIGDHVVFAFLNGIPHLLGFSRTWASSFMMCEG